MNRRELLKIGMKGILVAPLIAIGIKVLSESEWDFTKDVPPYDRGNSNLQVFIDGKEIEPNIFARIEITFGGGGPPVYKFEYIDEDEL